MRAELSIALLVVGAAASCDSSPEPTGGMEPSGGRGGAGGEGGMAGTSPDVPGGTGGAGGSSPSGGSPAIIDAGGAGPSTPDAGETDASTLDAGADPVDAGGGTGGAATEQDSGAASCDGAVRCGDGTCRPGSARCDGIDDCTDGSDENAYVLLEQRCGSASCHGLGSVFGDFAGGEDRAAAFVGVEPSLCEEAGVMIDPNDPPSSYLVQKLTDDPQCGLRMPLVGDLFSDTEVACVERWISGL